MSFDVVSGDVAIVKADGDTSGRTGHFHVFIDRPAVGPGEVIPKEPGILHTTDAPVVLNGLAAGHHHFTVVLGDGTHRRIGDAHLDADVLVEGPAVTASALASVPSGEPATIDIRVDGIDLRSADGDSSGRTGHLHLFVDRDPTPAGQPIPKEDGIIHTTETAVSLPGLAPGAHTVWVVLGDGTHMPLSPPVMAVVNFVVTG